jgi:hypothetical protein
VAHPIKPIEGAAVPILERLRSICLALPQATEKLAWGEPTFRAGSGKIFAQLDNHHHGADHIAVWLPAQPGAQDVLVQAEPRRFFVPPYCGPKGWIGIRLDDDDVDWDQVAGLVEEAYRLVAPKKLVAQLEVTPVKTAPGAAG